MKKKVAFAGQVMLAPWVHRQKEVYQRKQECRASGQNHSAFGDYFSVAAAVVRFGVFLETPKPDGEQNHGQYRQHAECQQGFPERRQEAERKIEPSE